MGLVRRAATSPAADGERGAGGHPSELDPDQARLTVVPAPADHDLHRQPAVPLGARRCECQRPGPAGGAGAGADPPAGALRAPGAVTTDTASQWADGVHAISRSDPSVPSKYTFWLWFSGSVGRRREGQRPCGHDHRDRTPAGSRDPRDLLQRPGRASAIHVLAVVDGVVVRGRRVGRGRRHWPPGNRDGDRQVVTEARIHIAVR